MKVFDSRYIDDELDKLANTTKGPIDMVVIGGGTMSRRGLKIGTKDMDIIVHDLQSYHNLMGALQEIGYSPPEGSPDAYVRMGSRSMMENSDGFWWDIFYREVAGFPYTETMIERARDMVKLGPMTVRWAALEDIGHQRLDDLGHVHIDPMDHDDSGVVVCGVSKSIV